jgi:uncharacterized protein (TIGR03435 family)
MANVLLSLMLVASLGYCSTSVAQRPDSAMPVYDIVSIRPNHSFADGMTMDLDKASTLRAENVSLKQLMVNAYGVRDALMFGLPGWADSLRFDITAKVSDPDVKTLSNLSTQQREAMLAAILVDRFHLKVHTEIETLPVYELIVAKGGLKLKKAVIPLADSGGSDPLRLGTISVNATEIDASGITLSDVAMNLGLQLDRSVIDKTGVAGRYACRLTWTVDGTGSTDAAPDMFTALQEQLGLKLQTSKGPVQTLVIDHVAQPTSN